MGKAGSMVCTLDLEDHYAQDPAARRIAGRIIDYALRAPLCPRAGKVVYLGGATGAAWLNQIGVSYQPSATLDNGAGLLLIGSEAAFDPAALNAYLEQGGKAFFLPREQAEAGLGATLKRAASDFAGSLSPPDWPEARGLSGSDLRWRSVTWTLPRGWWAVARKLEPAACLAAKRWGTAWLFSARSIPTCFRADEKTYFRYTRWRATRAVAQLLANLGASFAIDSQVFHPLDTSAMELDFSVGPNGDRSGPQATGPRAGPAVARNATAEGRPASEYYYPDYRTDFPMGDNPYRYYRW